MGSKDRSFMFSIAKSNDSKAKHSTTQQNHNIKALATFNEHIVQETISLWEKLLFNFAFE